jgi:glutathione S-transferase
MKLYYHPASTTSRPIMLYAEDNGLALEYRLVDLFHGEQYKDEFVAVNPCHMVPVLDDGDFRLTESSAILKYLASKYKLPSYPTNDLKKRAKVDEIMDWFNTQFYRDYGYGLTYPQIYDHHKRPSDAIQAGTIAWGQEKAKGWFQILNDYWLGPKKQYLVGDEMTIADYFGVCLVTMGEVIKCDFSAYPNVDRWVNNMRKLKSWKKVNEAHYGFADYLKDKPFKTL